MYFPSSSPSGSRTISQLPECDKVKRKKKRKFEKSYQTTFVRPPHFTRLLPVVRSGTQLVAEWVEMYGKMWEKKYWKIWIIKFIIRE